MREDRFSFERGTLWKQVQERSAKAKKRGALQAIQTTSEFVEQEGLQFLVRIVSSLAKKDLDREDKSRKVGRETSIYNPFLPYDEDLWVTDISLSHVCLLNKFSVIDHHILLVTRAFEHQESFLTVNDFEAMWICMAEYEGLAFYNSGTIAGASQSHKHMQMVPLPLASRGPKVPIESVLKLDRYRKRETSTGNLPFVHAISQVNPQSLEFSRQGAEQTLEDYYSLLQAVGLRKDNTEKPLGAYNLLVTRKWMLLIPRSRECFESISINALGFAGAFLVKNSEQMQLVKQTGPLTILREVSVAW